MPDEVVVAVAGEFKRSQLQPQHRQHKGGNEQHRVGYAEAVQPLAHTESGSRGHDDEPRVQREVDPVAVRQD